MQKMKQIGCLLKRHASYGAGSQVVEEREGGVGPGKGSINLKEIKFARKNDVLNTVDHNIFNYKRYSLQTLIIKIT